jgi:hypothetical protein
LILPFAFAARTLASPRAISPRIDSAQALPSFSVPGAADSPVTTSPQTTSVPAPDGRLDDHAAREIGERRHGDEQQQ